MYAVDAHAPNPSTVAGDTGQVTFCECEEIAPADFDSKLLSKDAFSHHRIPLPLMALICDDRRQREKESERNLYIWKIDHAHTYTFEQSTTAFVSVVSGQVWCRRGLDTSYRAAVRARKDPERDSEGGA